MGFLAGARRRERRNEKRKIENEEFINNVHTNTVYHLNPLYYHKENSYTIEEINKREKHRISRLNFFQRHIHHLYIWLNNKFNKSS